MATRQVDGDERQSGELEVHVGYRLAAPPEDACVDREQGRGRG